MDSVAPTLQPAASAQTCLPSDSAASFVDESDGAQSLDDPLLETCKRELDALLASLDTDAPRP